MPREEPLDTSIPIRYGADREHLESDFIYHAPFGDQAKRYEAIRDAGGILAAVMLALCPPSAERTLAYRKVQEAVMWANASIALNEQPTPAE